VPIQKNQATRQILLAELTKGICKITFIKKDGSARIAFSTLNSLLIPAHFEKSIQKIFLEDANQDIIPFWDIAQGKWKSFYVNSLENLVTAEELSKNSPGTHEKQKDYMDNVTDANEMQQIIKNKNSNIEKEQRKSKKLGENNGKSKRS